MGRVIVSLFCPHLSSLIVLKGYIPCSLIGSNERATPNIMTRQNPFFLHSLSFRAGISCVEDRKNDARRRNIQENCRSSDRVGRGISQKWRE